MVLVTGASGQVGIRILRALAAKDVASRAWIHSDRSKEEVLAAGATEVFVGDMESRNDAVRAMQEVDTVVFICNTANPHEDAIGAQLIEVAKEMGDITFVYHSVLHSLLSEMPHHMRKREVERMLVDSGIPYVILQPAPFMQTLTPAVGSVKAGGPLVQKFFSTNDMRMSFVDMDDYAEAAVEAITSNEYLYGTYELCGNGAYALPDLERIASEIAEREVGSAFISDSDFLKNAHLDPAGYQAQTLLTMFRHYNASDFRGNSFTLSHILGRAPKTLHEFLSAALREE